MGKFLVKNRLYLVKTVNYYYVGVYIRTEDSGLIFKDAYIVPTLEWDDYVRKDAKGHHLGDLWINRDASLDISPWNTISTLP